MIIKSGHGATESSKGNHFSVAGSLEVAPSLPNQSTDEPSQDNTIDTHGDDYKPM